MGEKSVKGKTYAIVFGHRIPFTFDLAFNDARNQPSPGGHYPVISTAISTAISTSSPTMYMHIFPHIFQLIKPKIFLLLLQSDLPFTIDVKYN